MKNTFLNADEFAQKCEYGHNILSLADIYTAYPQWTLDIATSCNNIYTAIFSPTIHSKDQSQKLKVTCTISDDNPTYETTYISCNP